MAATIELYLVRHAIAAERGPELSRRSRAAAHQRRHRALQARRSRVSRNSTSSVDLVLTSPLVRAKHTAELLVAGLPASRGPRSSTRWRPAAGCRRCSRPSRSTRSATASIALVGHEPDLGELAAKLLQARGEIEFKKGAVCCIELDGAMPTGPGILRWLLPPRALRKIAR